MKCKICNFNTENIFEALLLDKYNVKYFHCKNCGCLFTEEPYWLEEAYKDAISIADTGILARNTYFSKVIANVIYNFFDKDAKFLEYAGGYGVLTRMMRDIGFDFCWDDKYSQNIFANGFEYDKNFKIELLTAIEVFEHLANPLEEIEKMFEISGNIIFSQTLLPEPVPAISDWWYYASGGGQHVYFYTAKTLEYIAVKFNKNYVFCGDLHLFTDKNINQKQFEEICRLMRKNIDGIESVMTSKTVDDMYKCINLMNKG